MGALQTNECGQESQFLSACCVPRFAAPKLKGRHLRSLTAFSSLLRGHHSLKDRVPACARDRGFSLAPPFVRCYVPPMPREEGVVVTGTPTDDGDVELVRALAK